MGNRVSDPSVCPSPTAWQALLAGALPDLDMHRMEAHLEHCPACAEGLSSLAPAAPPLLQEAARETVSHLEAPDIWYLRLRTSMLDDSQGEPTASGEGTNREFETEPEMLLPAPARIGDYELVERIGRGGMGVVFRARQIKLQREVAVKMLPIRTKQSPAAVDRLIAEARRMAQIRHPNIVQVYDVGEQDQMPFFSMELIEGTTLSQAARLPEPWHPRRVAQLVISVAEAVQAAHSVGMIHRDLKPANILLTVAGEPKVTDFGLATTRNEAMTVGSRGVAGTAEYMSPEQWAGDADLVTVRTDIYGLGTILYAMLTGRPPFPRDPNPVVTRQRVLYESSVPPRSVRPNVPRDLEAICLRCLEKSPDERYGSAQEVAADLRRFLRCQPVNARPVGFAQRAAYAFRRNWAQLTTAAAIILLAAGIIGAYGLSERNRTRLAESNKLFDLGVSAATEGRVNDGIAQIQAAIERLPDRQTDLKRYYRQTQARWQMLAPRKPSDLPLHPAAITAASMAPNGQVLFGDTNGGVFVWSPASGSVRPLGSARSSGEIRATAVNRTGTRCAAIGNDFGVRVWDVETGAQVTECRVERSRIYSFAFLGEGDVFVTDIGSNSGALRLWSAKSSPAQQIGTGDERISGFVTRLIPSPDGTTFLAGNNAGLWWLCDRAGQVQVDLVREIEMQISAAAYSPDGSRLAIATSTVPQIVVFDVPTRQVLQRSPQFTDGVVKHIEFRQDGGVNCILDTGSRSIVRQMTPELDCWEDIPLDSRAASIHSMAADRSLLLTGRESRQLHLAQLPPLGRCSVHVGRSAEMGNVAVSADGRRVLTRILAGRPFSEPQPFDVSVGDGSTLQKIASLQRLPNDSLPSSIAHHPSSNEIAVGCNSGDVLFGQPAAGGSIELQALGSHQVSVNALTFAPNGLHLYSGSQESGGGGGAEVVRWDAVARTETHRITFPSSIREMTVSADSQWLAVGGADGIVRVFPAANLDIAAAVTFTAESAVSSLAFSPDGRLLACGTMKGRLVLLRRESGRLTPVPEPPGLQSCVASVRFAPDSKIVYACGIESNAGVVGWCTDLGKPVGPPFPLPGRIRNFEIAPGPSIICLTADGRMTMIPVIPVRDP